MLDQPRAAAKPVILVLDDDSAVRNSLKFLLQIEGFDVRSYASSSELLNDPDLPAFNCLVVDLHMPEMNGLDVVVKLRERKDALRAILITSHPSPSIRERAAALGVPIVLKPFRERELVERICAS